MKIEKRTFGMADFIRIPWRCGPVHALLICIHTLLSGLVPTLQVIVTAYFINTAIDIVQRDAPLHQIYPSLFAVIALIAYNWVSSELIKFVRVRLEKEMREQFRTAVIQKRARLEYKHIENHETWDVLSRVSKQPEKQAMGAFNDVLSLTAMMVRIGGLLALLVVHVWWAALLILSFSIPLFRLAVKSGKATYQANREVSKYKRRNEYLSEVLTSRETVNERALFGFGKAVNRMYRDHFEKARGIEFKTELKWFVKMKSGSVLTALISMLMIIVLLQPVLAGKLSIGMFISLVNAVFGLTGMMSWQLTNLVDRLAKHHEYLKDLTAFAALEESDSKLEVPIRPVPRFESLEFKDVSFAYPGTKQKILNGMSFRIEAGKHYSFVGINGAGKTTITKLMTGLYADYEGQILLNGKELRTYSPGQLKAFYAVVYQDFAKYELRMIDNIAVGDVSRMEDDRMAEQVNEAVDQVGLRSAAAKLKQGIYTPLGKIHADGQDISGGEWQRAAMARALVNPAPIRILDEPTAALDPLSESKLYEEFELLSKDKTTLFISHRLGSTKLADEIFVIGDGRILEHGSHEELMQRSGIYADMYEKQRSWYQ